MITAFDLSSVGGLSEGEARRRLRTGGPNELRLG
jgi:hypothetical protein